MRNVLRAGSCVVAMLASTCLSHAADLPRVMPAAPVVPWSWTGFYAGIHFANGWANNTWRDGAGLLGDPAFTPFIGAGAGNGPVGGGQVGLNYQTGSWVWGAEIALGLADINAQTACAKALFICSTKIDGLGTATGRLGFGFDQFLIYGKAGAAVEHVHDQLVPFPEFNVQNNFSGTRTRWGWTAGLGLEFAFSPALSAIAEYDFIDFGTRANSVIDQNGNRAGIATSENVHLIKVGLNYKLGQGLPWSAAASAVPILPAPPPAAWNWSGVYIGGHVGGGWGRTNWNSATGILGARNGVFAGSSTDNGFAIGGQVGINHQVGAWVVGAEADASWSDIDGYTKCATNEDPSGSFTCHTRVKALGTLTGRLGQSFGNLLVYGKGGAAWDAERHGALEDQPNSQFAGDTTRWGWTAGVGLEYAFTPAWSGKVEYNFMRFADKTMAVHNAHGAASNVGLSQDLSVFKMGFNYKLGADPTAGSRAPVPAPMWVKSPVFKAPPPSDWTIEAGARYWVSSGRKQLDLFGATSSVFLSRLTYDGVIGQAAESFARLDHRNGMFLKGNFGLGDLTKGKFYDEDTHAPDHIVGYSNTRSNQGDGRTLYGSLDVGHAVVTGPGGDLGAYVGYRYLYERDNGFGGSQIAASRSIFFQGAAPFSTLILSETEAWSGAAVGLNTRLQLAERWRLEVDAALLPFLGVWNTDNHWLRANFNPLPAQGPGWGSQFEAILSYALTDQWSIGAGGRYWYFASSSVHTQSPNAVYNQPIKLFSERYGGFLQATYKFDGKPSAAPAGGYKAQSGPTTWTGFYAGGHIGAGLGRTTWSDPFPPPALGDYVSMGGALAGGQLGFNYQTGALVYGVEAAGSWARIAGTFTCFAGNPDISVAGQDCGAGVGALASFTGRLGYALDRTLYYAKAGPAWGRSTFQLNFGAADAGQIVTTSVNRAGWTLGGGVEQALTDKWSVVGEYRYVDLGSVKVSFSGIPDSISTDGPVAINQRYHMLMLGMNYRLY